MKTSRSALAALTAALALAVTACGSDDAPANPADSATPTSDTSSAQTASAAPSSSSSSSSSTTSSTSSSPTTGAVAGPDAVFAAIAAAEKKAGGTAYEIDDQDDDGSWEVDVAKGSQSIEVDVTADGKATIADAEDDLDDDDRAGLKAAKIDLPQAIKAALAKVDGTFDDAELEEEDGKHFWTISIDVSGDDTEVRVDVVTGKATPEQDG